MSEYTVTRDGGVITVHEGDHGSEAVATFVGYEGEQLFEAFVSQMAASDLHTFWDANRAEYLT